ASEIVFASELLSEFADALGIVNGVTSYEYLKEEEDAVGWDQFIHVPDRSREQARLRRADLELEERKAALMREGLLLAERGGHAGLAGPAPYFCASADGRGFLVCWSGHLQAEGAVPLERFGPPWSSGPADIGLAIDPRLFVMALSSSGRYLASGH